MTGKGGNRPTWRMRICAMRAAVTPPGGDGLSLLWCREAGWGFTNLVLAGVRVA